jgi:hypothetical protein
VGNLSRVVGLKADLQVMGHACIMTGFIRLAYQDVNVMERHEASLFELRPHKWGHSHACMDKCYVRTSGMAGLLADSLK